MRLKASEARFPAPQCLTILAAAALAWPIACGGRNHEPDKPDKAEKARQGPPRIELTPAAVAAAGIKTEPVVLRPVDEILSLTGTLGYDENKVAHVAPRIGGHITRILGVAHHPSVPAHRHDEPVEEHVLDLLLGQVPTHPGLALLAQ